MRRIIVDIDNTLWDFASSFRGYLLGFNPAVPPVAEWTDYNFWKAYVKVEEFNLALAAIHGQQERFLPFADARPFLEGLKNMGLRVVVASHRDTRFRDGASRWLEMHRLPFDELSVLDEKAELFGDAWAVVDDSPVTLRKAILAGIVHTGLTCPWNDGNGYPLFATLSEVLDYLRERAGVTGIPEPQAGKDGQADDGR